MNTKSILSLFSFLCYNTLVLSQWTTGLSSVTLDGDYNTVIVEPNFSACPQFLLKTNSGSEGYIRLCSSGFSFTEANAYIFDNNIFLNDGDLSIDDGELILQNAGSDIGSIESSSSNLRLSTANTSLDLVLGTGNFTDIIIDGTTGNVQVENGLRIGSTSESVEGNIRYGSSNGFQAYDGSDWLDFAIWKGNNAGNIFQDEKTVGIGTEATAMQLTLESIGGNNLWLRNVVGTNNFIRFDNSNGATGYVGKFTSGSVDDFQIGTASSNDDGKLQLVTDGISRVHILPTGEVGIGTSTPSHMLHVAGDVAVAGVITHPSDERLKENISPINNALDMINDLNPTTYSYKEEHQKEFGLSEGVQMGFIAQELEQILPHLVIDEAMISESGEEYKGVNYEQLVPLLVKALQEEHQQKIALENRLDLMEVQLNRILAGMSNNATADVKRP